LGGKSESSYSPFQEQRGRGEESEVSRNRAERKACTGCQFPSSVQGLCYQGKGGSIRRFLSLSQWKSGGEKEIEKKKNGREIKKPDGQLLSDSKTVEAAAGKEWISKLHYGPSRGNGNEYENQTLAPITGYCKLKPKSP